MCPAVVGPGRSAVTGRACRGAAPVSGDPSHDVPPVNRLAYGRRQDKARMQSDQDPYLI